MYASCYAESTVNHLINFRHKNKQRMTWIKEKTQQTVKIRATKTLSHWKKIG